MAADGLDEPRRVAEDVMWYAGSSRGKVPEASSVDGSRACDPDWVELLHAHRFAEQELAVLVSENWFTWWLQVACVLMWTSQLETPKRSRSQRRRDAKRACRSCSSRSGSASFAGSRSERTFQSSDLPVVQLAVAREHLPVGLVASRRSRKHAKQRARRKAKLLLAAVYSRCAVRAAAAAAAVNPEGDRGEQQGRQSRQKQWLGGVSRRRKELQRRKSQKPPDVLRCPASVMPSVESVPSELQQCRPQVSLVSAALPRLADDCQMRQKRRRRQTRAIGSRAPAPFAVELPAVGRAVGSVLGRRELVGAGSELKKGGGGSHAGGGALSCSLGKPGPERTYRKAGRGVACTHADFPPGSGYWQKDDLQKAKRFADRQARGQRRARKRYRERSKIYFDLLKAAIVAADQTRGSLASKRSVSSRRKYVREWLSKQHARWLVAVERHLSGIRHRAWMEQRKVQSGRVRSFSPVPPGWPALGLRAPVASSQPVVQMVPWRSQGATPRYSADELVCDACPRPVNGGSCRSAVLRSLDALRLLRQRALLRAAGVHEARKLGLRRSSRARVRCRIRRGIFGLTWQLRLGKVSRTSGLGRWVRKLQKQVAEQKKRAAIAYRSSGMEEDVTGRDVSSEQKAPSSALDAVSSCSASLACDSECTLLGGARNDRKRGRETPPSAGAGRPVKVSIRDRVGRIEVFLMQHQVLPRNRAKNAKRLREAGNLAEAQRFADETVLYKDMQKLKKAVNAEDEEACPKDVRVLFNKLMACKPDSADGYRARAERLQVFLQQKEVLPRDRAKDAQLAHEAGNLAEAQELSYETALYKDMQKLKHAVNAEVEEACPKDVREFVNGLDALKSDGAEGLRDRVERLQVFLEQKEVLPRNRAKDAQLAREAGNLAEAQELSYETTLYKDMQKLKQAVDAEDEEAWPKDVRERWDTLIARKLDEDAGCCKRLAEFEREHGRMPRDRTKVARKALAAGYETEAEKLFLETALYKDMRRLKSDAQGTDDEAGASGARKARRLDSLAQWINEHKMLPRPGAVVDGSEGDQDGEEQQQWTFVQELRHQGQLQNLRSHEKAFLFDLQQLHALCEWREQHDGVFPRNRRGCLGSSKGGSRDGLTSPTAEDVNVSREVKVYDMCRRLKIVPSRRAAGGADDVFSGHRLADYLRYLRACREECVARRDRVRLDEILDCVDAWSDEHAGELPKSVELLDPEDEEAVKAKNLNCLMVSVFQSTHARRCSWTVEQVSRVDALRCRYRQQVGRGGVVSPDLSAWYLFGHVRKWMRDCGRPDEPPAVSWTEEAGSFRKWKVAKRCMLALFQSLENLPASLEPAAVNEVKGWLQIFTAQKMTRKVAWLKPIEASIVQGQALGGKARRAVARVRSRLLAGGWSEETIAHVRSAFPNLWRCVEDLAGACRSQRARERLLDIQQVSDQETGSDEEWDGEEAPDVVMEDPDEFAAANLPVSLFNRQRLDSECCQGLRSKLISALAMAVERCFANFESVSPAIFVEVQSDPEVSEEAFSVLKAYSLTAEYRLRVREFLRSQLLGTYDFERGELQKGVFMETSAEPLVDFDVEKLVETALTGRCSVGACAYGQACGCEGCVPARKQAKAIRWLKKHFPLQAMDAARAAGASSGQEFWRDLLEDLEAEGEVCSQRVCCQQDVRVRLSLRANGRLERFVHPMLPVFAKDGRSLRGPTVEARRKMHFTPSSAVVAGAHGSALVWLPGDFLCASCKKGFLDRDFTLAMSPQELSAWCSQLFLDNRDVDAADMQEELAYQQNLLRNRDELIRLGQFVDAGKFFHFLGLVKDEFASERVSRRLVRGAAASIPSGSYWESTQASSAVVLPGFFGFPCEADGSVYCLSVGVCDEPATWTDYTGRPGVCSDEVWRWRCLAMARGGFCALTSEEQGSMVRAEAKADVLYCREWHSASGEWQSVATMCPLGNVPTLKVWCQSVAAGVAPERLREAVLRERTEEGLSFVRGSWEYDALRILRRARDGGVGPPLQDEEAKSLQQYEYLRWLGPVASSDPFYMRDVLNGPAKRRASRLLSEWTTRSWRSWTFKLLDPKVAAGKDGFCHTSLESSRSEGAGGAAGSVEGVCWKDATSVDDGRSGWWPGLAEVGLAGVDVTSPDEADDGDVHGWSSADTKNPSVDESEASDGSETDDGGTADWMSDVTLEMMDSAEEEEEFCQLERPSSSQEQPPGRQPLGADVTVSDGASSSVHESWQVSVLRVAGESSASVREKQVPFAAGRGLNTEGVTGNLRRVSLHGAGPDSPVVLGVEPCRPGKGEVDVEKASSSMARGRVLPPATGVSRSPKYALTDDAVRSHATASLRDMAVDGHAYDGSDGSFEVFKAYFSVKCGLSIRGREWDKLLRSALRNALWEEEAAQLELRCEEHSLGNEELRQAISHVLQSFDLRPNMLNAEEATEKLCRMLGLTEEALLGGLDAEARWTTEERKARLTRFMWIVHAELADFSWKEFLFDAVTIRDRCRVMKRNHRLSCSVLYQCGEALNSPDDEFCSGCLKQVGRSGLVYGLWNLEGPNRLDDVAIRQRPDLVRQAKARSTYDPDGMPQTAERNRSLASPKVLGFNKPDDFVRDGNQPRRGRRRAGAGRVWSGARRLHQRGRMPQFRGTAPGEVRVFATSMTALPPHPCRLCSSDFATEAALRVHVDVAHKGWSAYRKRLWYEREDPWRKVEPVHPQVWRHCVARFAEELVSGSDVFPECLLESHGCLVEPRRLALGSLYRSVGQFGGLLSFLPAVVSDARRLLGPDWREGDVEAVCSALLEEPGSVYRRVLLQSSWSHQEPKLHEPSVSVMRVLCQQARVLPICDFWMDDGYVLSAVTRACGSCWMDPRLDDARVCVLGAVWAESARAVGGFDVMLRVLYDVVLLAGATSASAAVGQWLQSEDSKVRLCISPVVLDADETSMLNAIATLLVSADMDSRCLWHEGFALRLFSVRVSCQVSLPPWTCPGSEGYQENDAWWQTSLSSVPCAEQDVRSDGDGKDSKVHCMADLEGMSGRKLKSAVDDMKVDVNGLGQEDAARRSKVRHRRPCAVCARRHWASDLHQCYMFDAPVGREAEALLRDCEVTVTQAPGYDDDQLHESGEGDDQARLAEPESELSGRPDLHRRTLRATTTTRRRLADIRQMFSPQRYCDRWRFPCDQEDGCMRGIPLEELQRSCVKSPIDGSMWLLHRSAFEVSEDGTALPEQVVTVCGSCRSALGRKIPCMPKYALPNDFWIGKMPAVLRGLSEAAWMLLALARVCIRRYNCYSDSGHRMPKDLMIKAIVGNVCAFPQADGGALLDALPPCEREIVERMLICFTDADKDVDRAYVKELAVGPAEFKRAYDFFRASNVMYAEVPWHDGNARDLQPDPKSGMPRCFQACTRRETAKAFPRNARQEGPAEAVVRFDGGLSPDELAEIVNVSDELRRFLGLRSSDKVGASCRSACFSRIRRLRSHQHQLYVRLVFIRDRLDALEHEPDFSPQEEQAAMCVRSLGDEGRELEVHELLQRALAFCESSLTKEVLSKEDMERLRECRHADPKLFGDIRALAERVTSYNWPAASAQGQKDAALLRSVDQAVRQLSHREWTLLLDLVGRLRRWTKECQTVPSRGAEGSEAAGVCSLFGGERKLFQEVIEAAVRVKESRGQELSPEVQTAADEIHRVACLQLEAEVPRLADKIALWEVEHGGVPRGEVDGGDFEDAKVFAVSEEKRLHDDVLYLRQALASLEGAVQSSVDEGSADILHKAALGEQFEACVGIADQDMYGDVSKQWSYVDRSLRSILSGMQENVAAELAQQDAVPDGDDGDASTQARRAALKKSFETLQRFARDFAASGRRGGKVDDPAAGVEKRRPPPGELLPRHLHCSLAEFKAGSGREKWRLLVPSATAPLSMFDCNFWPCAFPRQFPYGDGGYGLERVVDVSLDDYLSYILQRDELEYPDKVPADSGPDSDVVCAAFGASVPEEMRKSIRTCLRDVAAAHGSRAGFNADMAIAQLQSSINLVFTSHDVSVLQRVVLYRDVITAVGQGDLWQDWCDKDKEACLCFLDTQLRLSLTLAQPSLLLEANWVAAARSSVRPDMQEPVLQELYQLCDRVFREATCVSDVGWCDGMRAEARKVVSRHSGSAPIVHGLLHAWLERITEYEWLLDEPDWKVALEDCASQVLEEHVRSWLPWLRCAGVAVNEGDSAACSRAEAGAGADGLGDGSTSARKGSVLKRASRFVERDFVSGLYCFWRRRSYIKSARLFADRQIFTEAMQDLGSIMPDQLFEAIGHLKKGQGVKDLLGNGKVHPNVKKCLRSLNLCMNTVLGTNSHRTFLRHVVAGYRNLWGPPLVFTTMNVADTKHPVMKLLYDGEEVCAWRLLEEDEPDLGSAQDLARRVAADPVSQAIFTDMMMRLFLKHMLSVDISGRAATDDVAASGSPGLFGDVQAFFAPLESQGRGGLHAHMSVWVLHAMKGRILDKLRHGELDTQEWKDRLRAWRLEVLEKVGSMQFDCVEEFGRQTGCDAGEVEGLRRPAPEDAEAVQRFQDWYDKVLQDQTSVETYSHAVKLSKEDAATLAAQLADLEGASPASLTESDPVPSSDVSCGICQGTARAGTCPGCRQRPESDVASVGPGFLQWHRSLWWRGLRKELPRSEWEKLLAHASSVPADSRKTYALLASVEFYSRDVTRFARAACAGDRSVMQRKELLLGAVSQSLASIRELQSPFEASQDQDEKVEAGGAYIRWHRDLVAALPDEGQEHGFLASLRDDSDDSADAYSAATAALSLSVACYVASCSAEPGHDSVVELFDCLRDRAARPSALAAGTSSLLRAYLAWRDDRKSGYGDDPFAAVENYAEKECLYEGDVPPLPLSCDRQERTFMDGKLEQKDAMTLEPPRQAMDMKKDDEDADQVRWRDGPVLQARRQRQYAPMRAAASEGRCGDPCMECPAWRRAPPYKASSVAGGRAFITIKRPEVESRIYSRKFSHDARRNYVRSHIHKCKKTCAKCGAGRQKCGPVQLCRFHFVRGHLVLFYPRRWPAKVSPCKSLDCVFAGSSKAGVPVCGRVHATEVRNAAGDSVPAVVADAAAQRSLHPCHCPPLLPTAYVKRLPRLGKALVLPRVDKSVAEGRFRPHVSLDEGYGGLGKVCPLRYHPDCSSSHPALQVCFRCNFDVQCTDRVPVLVAFRSGTRKVRVRRSSVEAVTAEAVALGLKAEEGNALSHDPISELESRVEPGELLEGSEDVCRRPSGSGPLRLPVFSPVHFEAEPCTSGTAADSLWTADAAAAERHPRLRVSVKGGGLFDSDEESFGSHRDDDSDGSPVVFGRPVESAELSAPPVAGSSSGEPHADPLVDAWADGPPSQLPSQPASDGDVSMEGEEDDDFGRLPRTYKFHIEHRWSDLIAAGIKTVEGRVLRGMAKHVRKGDSMLLNDVVCRVTRVRKFPSGGFRAMLECLWQEHGNWSCVVPGARSMQECLDVYHGYQDYETLAAAHGVVAFDVELHEHQPHWKSERSVIMTRETLQEYFVPIDAEDEVFCESFVQTGEEVASPEAGGDARDCGVDASQDVEAKAEGEWKQVSWQASTYEAFKRTYRIMSNIAHYQTDYSTKANPMMGNELAEQFVGVERLRKEESRDGVRGGQSLKLSVAALQESGRKTLIRLQTAANRASLKKLPEMAFQMLYRHECYQSHKPWTVFCKGLMWNAFVASQVQQQLTEKRICDLGWTEEKLRVLEDVSKMESQYATVEGDNEVTAIAEPADVDQVLIGGEGRARQARSGRAGRRRSRGSGGPVDEEAGHAEDGGVGEGAGVEEPFVYVKPHRSMKEDWLHRGTKPILASMGLYHYAMFVYTAQVSANCVPREDELTFRFADTHPDYHTRVQKLRIHDMCRVPKIMGFTMPRQDGVSSDAHRNTMFKSSLFRPALPQEGLNRDLQLVSAMMLWTDRQGRYERKWNEWWSNQVRLADRYYELQRRSRTAFTLADVELEVGPHEGTVDRLRPSVYEFMAHITVEAATHLEVGAQSRAGRPVVKETPGGSFGFDGDVDEEDGYDGAEDAGLDDGTAAGAGGARTKHVTPLHRIDQQDAFSVAMADDNHPDTLMKNYFSEFKQSMEGDLQAPPPNDRGDAVGEEASAFSWPRCGAFEHQRDSALFEACLSAQKKEFDKWKAAVEAPLPEAGGPDEMVSNSFIRWDPESVPQLAELRRMELPRAVRFVQEAVRRLNTGPKPVALNQEQREFLALVASHCDEWLQYKLDKTNRVADAEEPSPMRILLCGPGGSGKSEVIKVVRKMCEYCFGEDSHKALAASNSAARGVGGDTVHAGLFLNGLCRFSLPEVDMPASQPFMTAWQKVHCLMLEEVSMIHPQMFGGMSYRLCKGLEGQRGCEPAMYAHPDHMFGRIPLLIMLGDFMQLAPIDDAFQRMSLVMEPKDAWQEDAKAGQRCFHDCLTHVIFFRKTHRFRSYNEHTGKYEDCPILAGDEEKNQEGLLDFMRDPRGRDIPPHLLAALKSMERRQIGDDARVGSPTFRAGYEMAIAWHAVLRVMHLRAAREAAEAKRILLYVQAVDISKKQKLGAQQYRKALQVVNMTHTGKLLGMCPLFVGMRVRLGAKLCAKHGIVHDAPGTVKGFQFDPREDLSFCTNPRSDAARTGKHLLKYLPKAVLVKFDGVDVDFGFGEAGVVAVPPNTMGWKFKTHDDWSGLRKPIPVEMSRSQIPLCPERVRTVQTAQGLTMDACTMFLGQPGNMSGSTAQEDDYWIHLYVMLSRVRSAKNCLLYGVPSYRFLQRGPPRWMSSGIAELECKASDSREMFRSASEKCGWLCSRDVGGDSQGACRDDENRQEASRLAEARQEAAKHGETWEERQRRLERAKAARLQRQRAVAGSVEQAASTASQEVSDKQKEAVKRNERVALARRVARLEPELAAREVQKAKQRSSAAETGVGGSKPVNTFCQSSSAEVAKKQVAKEPASSGAGRAGAEPSSEEEDGTSLLVSTEALSAEKLSRLARCPNELLMRAYGMRRVELELLTVCTVAGWHGLPNEPGRNVCFVNAALQCFLRLEAVWRLLDAHAGRHKAGRSGCLACQLAEVAERMRTGKLRDAEEVVGAVRAGLFGAVFKSVGGPSSEDSQCDATDLIFGDPEDATLSASQASVRPIGFIGVLNAWEARSSAMSEDELLQSAVRQKLFALPSFIFGITLRSRKACQDCGYVVDDLERVSMLQLGVRETLRGDRLTDMWKRYFRDVANKFTKCADEDNCSASGIGNVCKRYYLEREPPVLAIRILRGRVDQAGRRYKVCTPVEFPEVLDVMRTGEYHLASVILHSGQNTTSGHYYALCWHGAGEYYIYNDDVDVSRVSWSHCSSAEVKANCYMLFYVRTRFWNGEVCDGSEKTPYARDEASQKATCPVSVDGPACYGAGADSARNDDGVASHVSAPPESAFKRRSRFCPFSRHASCSGDTCGSFCGSGGDRVGGKELASGADPAAEPSGRAGSCGSSDAASPGSQIGSCALGVGKKSASSVVVVDSDEESEGGGGALWTGFFPFDQVQRGATQSDDHGSAGDATLGSLEKRHSRNALQPPSGRTLVRRWTCYEYNPEPLHVSNLSHHRSARRDAGGAADAESSGASAAARADAPELVGEALPTSADAHLLLAADSVMRAGDGGRDQDNEKGHVAAAASLSPHPSMQVPPSRKPPEVLPSSGASRVGGKLPEAPVSRLRRSARLRGEKPA